MRMSKSFAALTSNSEAVSPDRNRPPRRRSSLDTFVIPGRTRLPSSRVSHPEPMDLKIAQSLLNAESGVLPRKSSYPGKVDALNPPKRRRSNAPLQRIEDSKDLISDSPSKYHLDIPGPRSDDPLNIGSQDHQVDGIDEHPFPHHTSHIGSGSGSQDLGNYDLPISHDAPNDVSSNGSRNTTSTWTTVSGRNFTSSSAGSQRLDSGPSIKEFNRLATEHGLSELVEAPDCFENESRHSLASIPSTRAHHHSWLVRKLLRRTSSTFNMKAKVGTLELRRKRSAYTLSGIQPRPRKDILKDRSLEEISRLGGLSILILPRDFAAIDKLVLPSCVSATVHYLVHNGSRAPGIFRVPGQLSTVNALYDYYSNRFLNYSNVDDPNTIQSTVGSRDLPAHIEYTVHDVASLLKKILLGFPGGLLGSLSLLKAISGIATNGQRGPDQPEADFVALKARLIALAISSVTSDHRFSLICAILGLAALIGHESEKAAHGKPNAVSSELMSYHALSLVLGPLLLGDALNDVFGSESLGGQRNPITESPKRYRKQKRESVVEQKLLQSEALVAHVNTAKSTAKACEMLISNWKDVVKQLRDLAVNGTSGSQYRDNGQQLASGKSRFTLSSSEDGFVGVTHPSDVFLGPFELANKVRHSNSRSRPSRSPKRSSSHKGPDWLHDACVTNSSEGAPLLPSSGKKDSKPRQLHLPRTNGRQVSKVHFAGHPGRSSDRQSLLQHGTDAPIPDELILRHPFITADMTRVTKPLYETQEQFDNTPANEDHTSGHESRRDSQLSTSEASASLDRIYLGSSLSSNIVPYHAARSSTNARLADDDGANATGEPGRADLIDPNVQLSAEGPPEDAQLMADSFAWSRGFDVDPDEGLMIANSRTLGRPPARSEASSYCYASSNSSHYNNVRLLAQRFSQPSQGHYVPETPRDVLAPMVYADVYAAAIETRPSVPKKDTPTVVTGPTETQSPPLQVPEKECCSSLKHSKSDLGRGKESLIPRPVHELGRARRKGASRSPSPSKETTPVAQVRQRPSILNVLPDDHLSIAVSEGSNGYGADNSPKDVHVESFATNPASTQSQLAPRVPFVRKALTTSSMKASSPLDAFIKNASPARLPSSSISHVPTESDSAQRDRSPSVSQNSETGSIRHLSPASRSNTTNTSALFAEIRRLHRELERKSDEVNQVRRSLDVVRETGSSRERSCSREESSNENDTRKQLKAWKRRAEEAERKLRQESDHGEVGQRQTSEDAVESPEEYPKAERTASKALAGSEQSPAKAPQVAIQTSPGISSTEKLEAEQTPRKGLVGGEKSPENASQVRFTASPAVSTTARRETEQTPTKASAGSEQTPRKASQLAEGRSPGASSTSRLRGDRTPMEGPGEGVHSPRNGPHVTFQPPPGGLSIERRTQQRLEIPSGAGAFWKNI